MSETVAHGQLNQEGFTIPTTIALNAQQLGRIGEAIASAKLLSWGFEVYSPEVDDRGIDLMIRVPSTNTFHEVQVKSVTDNNYTFFHKKHRNSENNTDRLIFYIRFLTGGMQELFIIPESVWEHSNAVFMVYERAGKGDSLEHEYGINYSAKNRNLLMPYAADGILSDLLSLEMPNQPEQESSLEKCQAQEVSKDQQGSNTAFSRRCPYCDAQVTKDALFCDTCSSPLE